MARGMDGRSRVVTRHQREVLQVDRRWLLTWMVSFAGSLAFVAGLYGVYKVTGPHPEVTALVRGLKHEVRWLIPGLKHKPNAKDEGARLDVDGPRWAVVERSRG